MLLVETGSCERPGDAAQIEIGLRDSHMQIPSATPTIGPWNAGICAQIVFVDERDLVALPDLHRGGLPDENASIWHGRPTTQCSRKQGISAPQSRRRWASRSRGEPVARRGIWLDGDGVPKPAEGHQLGAM
jgi:hypothetical protein